MPDNGHSQAYNVEFLRAFFRGLRGALDAYAAMLALIDAELPFAGNAYRQMVSRLEPAKLHAPPALAVASRLRDTPVKIGSCEGPSVFSIAMDALEQAAEWWHELETVFLLGDMGPLEAEHAATLEFKENHLARLPRPAELLSAMMDEFEAAKSAATADAHPDNPGLADSDKASPRMIAKAFKIPLGALNSRLIRFRKKNPDGQRARLWVEMDDRTSRDAQYWYLVGAVRPIIDDLRTGNGANSKRIAKKNPGQKSPKKQ